MQDIGSWNIIEYYHYEAGDSTDCTAPTKHIKLITPQNTNTALILSLSLISLSTQRVGMMPPKATPNVPPKRAKYALTPLKMIATIRDELQMMMLSC